MTETAQPQKRRKNGLKKLVNTQTLRRISLFGFAAFIATVIIQHVLSGENAVTASPEAYCPFGGLETLYRYISSGGSFVPHTHLSNVVLLVGVLTVALLARSGFCGWICPLGFIQELVTDLSAFLQKHVSIVKRFIRGVQKHGVFLTGADRYLRFVKYAILVWAVAGAAIYGVMVFRDYDPWSTLINIAELSLGPGLAVLIILLLASFFVERPWCRYACPLGAISGLFGKLSPVYLKRQENLCKDCAICTKSCPMGLSVHKASTLKSVNCIGCLKCMEICPKAGALELKVGVPVIGK